MAESAPRLDEPIDVLKTETPPAERSPDTPESPSSPCESPDGKCAICLGKLENKSFTDSCFHTFCFTCLQEWSKVRPECPLCKQRFNSIIHNVRSNEEYDKYELSSQQQEQEDPLWYGYSNSRRFRYHSTMTAERRMGIALIQRLANRRVSTYDTRLHWRYRRQTATSEFRHYVYNNHMWVQPTTGRYRDTSPQFYRANPACLHRLVPWLNRELNVLLYSHESNVTFLLELILSLLPRFSIQSEEFREHISPFLSLRTAHFIHEFYHFARSLYDMVAYDQHANYNQNNQILEVIELSPESGQAQTSSEPQRPTSNRSSSINTINISSTSSPNSSSSDSTINVTDFLDKCEKKTCSSVVDKVRNFLVNVDKQTSINWDNSPLYSNTQTSQESWDTPNTSTGNNSDLNKPGPSGIQSTSIVCKISGWDSDSSNEPQSKLKKDEDDESSSESCVIVECLKPKRERTPDLITLDSGSDGGNFPASESPKNVASTSSHSHRNKSKKSKKSPKKKKSKRKIKKVRHSSTCSDS